MTKRQENHDNTIAEEQGRFSTQEKDIQTNPNSIITVHQHVRATVFSFSNADIQNENY